MFNLLILAFLDVRNPAPLSARLHQGHVLSASFGIVLLGLAAMGMLAGPRAPMAGWVALHSVAFLAVYALSMRTVFVYERSRIAALAEALTGEVRYADFTLAKAVSRYVAAAVVLVAAAAWLPAAGVDVARETGLEESFVGSLFIAISTSLPEIVVSIAAARLGAFDMAVGNLFGSNLFNIAVLAIDDILYTRGSLLAAVAPVHLVSLTTAIIMTGIAVVGLTYRASRKRYRLSWESLGLVAAYVIGAWMLQALG
jgi:cation:H+ antiporter